MVVFMPEKIIYALMITALVAVFYYFFYDDLFAFFTDPDNQVTIGKEYLGITRARDRE